MSERIRNRAYTLYLMRAGQTGDSTADWLAAERQILSEKAADNRVGPATSSSDSRKRGVTQPSGHDIENPT
jgi:hypothetical protein